MEFLGVGPSELIFIVIIALIVLGPKDMEKAGKTLGRLMRDIVSSDGWQVFMKTSRNIRNLPTQLIKQANDELRDAGGSIEKAFDLDKNVIASPRGSMASSAPPAVYPSNRIDPPNKPEPKAKPAETKKPKTKIAKKQTKPKTK